MAPHAQVFSLVFTEVSWQKMSFSMTKWLTNILMVFKACPISLILLVLVFLMNLTYPSPLYFHSLSLNLSILVKILKISTYSSHPGAVVMIGRSTIFQFPTTSFSGSSRLSLSESMDLCYYELEFDMYTY